MDKDIRTRDYARLLAIVLEKYNNHTISEDEKNDKVSSILDEYFSEE